MEKDDIERLKQKINADCFYPPVENIMRVKYPDGKFSFWQLDEKGKWSRLGLKYYSPATDKILTKYDFAMLSDFSDGVCILVDYENVAGTESKYNRGKFEPVLRYAVCKNGCLHTSDRFQNANAFQNGMGVVENYNNGNGGNYSYVTLDENKNFVYLPEKYLMAYDFDGEKAEVRTRQGLRKFINKQGEFISQTQEKQQ